MRISKLKQIIENEISNITEKFLIREENDEDGDDSSYMPTEKGTYHASAGDSKEFWGNRGAGILPLSKSTGRVLLVLRSQYVNEPGTWGMPGGKIDSESEPPKSAAKREMEEEVGYGGAVEIIPLYVFKAKNFKFYNFLGLIDDEFQPVLDWENDDAKWFDLDNLPKKLHFGIRAMLDNSKPLIEKIRKDLGFE